MKTHHHIVTHDPEWCACTCTCGWIAIYTGGLDTCARLAQEHLTTERENTP